VSDKLVNAIDGLTNSINHLSVSTRAMRIPQIRLREMCATHPIDRIEPNTLTSERNGYITAQTDYSSVIWTHIVFLARAIHSPITCVERDPNDFCGKYHGFFDKNCTRYPPLNELSEEQLELSVALASELSQIYNKYFLAANPTGRVKYVGDDMFVDVEIKLQE